MATPGKVPSEKLLRRAMNHEGDDSPRRGVRSYDEIRQEMQSRHGIKLSRARVYQILMRAEWKLRQGLLSSYEG